MANETKLQPALTPEEWKAWEDGGHGRVRASWDIMTVNPTLAVNKNGDITCYAHSPGGPHAGFTWENVERPVAVIALLNAALPDDDPRKITLADVNALDDIARQYYAHIGALRREGFRADAQLAENRVKLAERLVAKFAALLPPTEQRSLSE